MRSAELEYLLLVLARDLGLLMKDDHRKTCGELDEIERMLHGLSVKVEQGA